MKSLVVFYSRTGNTKKIAEEIAFELNSDIEEIIDKKNRKGFFGFLIAGKDATFNKLTQIEKTIKDPVQYDLVIIGTPIWSWGIIPSIRTYLNQSKFKNVAFFCTQDGSGGKRAFKQMEKMTQKPVAVLPLIAKEIKNNQYKEKLKEFCDKLNH